jgi:hypothetical protein
MPMLVFGSVEKLVTYAGNYGRGFMCFTCRHTRQNHMNISLRNFEYLHGGADLCLGDNFDLVLNSKPVNSDELD